MTPVKKDHLALSIPLKQKLIRAIRKYCILPEHSKTSYPSRGNHLFPSPPSPPPRINVESLNLCLNPGRWYEGRKPEQH